MPSLSRIRPALSFPLSVLLLVLIEYAVVQQMALASNPDVLAFAVTVDIVAGVPLLAYFLLVRPRRAPAAILAPLFLLAVLLANLVLPESGERYLNWIEMALPILEIALLLMALSKGRAIMRAYRTARPAAVYATDAFETALHRTLGDIFVVRIFVTEFSLLYYALAGWFARYSPTQASHRPFTYHVKSGYGVMALAVIGLSLVEIPLIHLVVNHFSPVAAWVLTILTLYTIVWLIGDYHAIRLHPIVVEGDKLHLRAGMRWRVTIARANIAALRPMTVKERASKSLLDLSAAGNPRLLLELRDPVTVRGLFGMKRVTDKIAFAVDDEAAFLALMNG